MTNIRPVSDLRNNFAEISRLVHETNEPVYLTKNGYGDMVVMSLEAYDELAYQFEVYYKLREAEREEESGVPGVPMEELFQSMRNKVKGYSWDEVKKEMDSILSEAEKNVKDES